MIWSLARTAKQFLESDKSATAPPEGNPVVRLQLSTDNSGSGNRKWKWWLAAAALPAFVIAGLMLIIESQKGQLVIESEAENVTVRLLSDGQQYDSVKVVPGATATQLFAGNYEITIDGASDDFVIDNESVTIRRGETVIARVRKQSSVPAIAEPPYQFSQDLIYEGKTLSEWIHQLAIEQSQKEVLSALRAIGALVGPTNVDEAKVVLLKLLPTIENRTVSIGVTEKSIDFRIFQILSAASQTGYSDFHQLIVDELKTADAAWAARLYQVAEVGWNVGANSLNVFRDWVIDDVFQNEMDANIVLMAARTLRNIILKSGVDTTIRQQTIAELQNNETLGIGFWLELMPPKFKTQTGNTRYSAPWATDFSEVVIKYAVRAIESKPTEDELAIRAAKILAHLIEANRWRTTGRVPGEFGYATPIDEKQIARIREAATDRIVAASDDEDELLKLVPVSEDFALTLDPLLGPGPN